MIRKRILFLLAFVAAFAVQIKADSYSKGRIFQFSPFDNNVGGPYYDKVTGKTLQAYNPETGEMVEYRHDKSGHFGDYRGFTLDSCLILDTDLKLTRNSQMTIMLNVHTDNAATTPGPVALMRIGQPDSLWYYPVQLQKNRMIYMEGKPSPEDSAMVRSRWHYDIQGGNQTTIYILIDMKTGRHTVYTCDSACVFYNDRLSQLDEVPNRLVFPKQHQVLIVSASFWNRLLTEKEIRDDYVEGTSKENKANYQLPVPVPIVDNIDEADGVMIHGWGWNRWIRTIGLTILILIWLYRRIRNIRVHYSFSGSPLILVSAVFGTWYLQSSVNFDVEALWIYNLANILSYYFISFRADPMYNLKNPGGIVGVINLVGVVATFLADIIDSCPKTLWEVTYVNRRTGSKTKKTETHYNIIYLIFWAIVIVIVVTIFIVFAQIIFQILPVITVCKFIINYFKERKAFKEARAQGLEI